MGIQELLGQARDAATVKRVFGEPHQEDGVTIIPVASVAFGGGGGEGQSPEGKGEGSGGGFGVSARPAGAYVVRDGEVTWQPAVDVNRAILMGSVVAVSALFTIRAVAKARAKARAKVAKVESS
jgi:uncharacterized spore protein YtfJ